MECWFILLNMNPNNNYGDKSQFLLFICVFGITIFSSIAQADEAEINELVKHAETYYWIGLSEQGNVDAYRMGLDYLDQAESSLKTADTLETEKQTETTNQLLT